MVKEYIPRRGDLVWLNFTPQSGHEQSGHRPALIISPDTYNRRVGLAIACPITSQVKNYPFEVPLPENFKVTGAIIVDQMKSVDWRERGATYITTAPNDVMDTALAKIEALLGFEK